MLLLANEKIAMNTMAYVQIWSRLLYVSWVSCFILAIPGCRLRSKEAKRLHPEVGQIRQARGKI